LLSTAHRPSSDSINASSAISAIQNQSNSSKGSQLTSKRQTQKGDKPAFYEKRCFTCKSNLHILRDCPFKTNRHAATKPANVNRVSHAETDCDDLPQFVGCESVKADVHAVKHDCDIVPRLSARELVHVYVDNVKLVALHDSDAEMTLKRRSVLGDEAAEYGRISVQGVFGPNASCSSVADLKRCVSDDHEVLEKPLRVMFAAVDEMNSDAFDVILTA
jgi:hypothetical protein